MEPKLLLIVGPTAVGKTEIALQLAERIGGEIISADSRLFYRGMDIGTAKPSAADRARVPHHLIDIVDPDQILSLAVFQNMARQAIDDIQARRKPALLVGGTGQYIRAVTSGWQPPEVQPDERLRSVLENLAGQHGNAWLHEKLNRLDPDAARQIDARNLRRTIRALEVILATGRKFSAQRGRMNPPYRLITLGLTRPRSELFDRIDRRIEAMFAAGFLQEVRGLLERGYAASLPSLSAIGYRECIQVIEGRWSLEQAKAEIRRATRVFVRRQANWFKQNDPAIHWFTVEADTLPKILLLLNSLGAGPGSPPASPPGAGPA